MAVTFSNARGATNNAAALGYDFTVAANCVLLAFQANDNGRSCSAMLYNGVPLTRLALAGGGECELWALTTPDAGIARLSAHMVGAALTFCVGAVTYTGVGEFGTAASGTAGSVNNANMSFSSTTTDICVGGFKINADLGVGSNGTLRLSQSASLSVRLHVFDIAGAATKSLSASCVSAVSWSFTGVTLKVTAVAAEVMQRFGALMGAGR